MDSGYRVYKTSFQWRNGSRHFCLREFRKLYSPQKIESTTLPVFSQSNEIQSHHLKDVQSRLIGDLERLHVIDNPTIIHGFCILEQNIILHSYYTIK